MRSLLWAMAAVSLTGTATFGQAVRPLSVEDALNGHRIMAALPTRVAASPDGELVAFTVQDRRRQNPNEAATRVTWTPAGTLAALLGTDVAVANLKTGAVQLVTDGTAASWGAVWSPDGRSLAFYSDRDGAVRIWVWDRSTGHVRRLSDVPAHTLRGTARLQWSSDGEYLIALVFPAGMTAADVPGFLAGAYGDEARGDTVAAVTVMHGYDDEAAANRAFGRDITLELLSASSRGDLAAIRIATGQVHRIALNVAPSEFWVSPTSREVAYVEIDTTRASRTRTFTLSVARLDNTKPRVLVQTLRQEGGFWVSWSPNGRLLSYIDGATRQGGDCYVVDPRGGTPVRVTPGVHPPLASPRYSGPSWSATGDAVYLLGADTIWRATIARRALEPIATVSGRRLVRIVGPSTGGRAWSGKSRGSVLVVTDDQRTMRMGIVRIDIATQRADPLFEDDQQYGPEHMMDVSAAGIVYLSQSATSPPDLWVADTDANSHRRLTTINPVLSSYAFGPSRLVHWRSLHGEDLTGVLILPAGYQPGRRYPLIVTMYPRHRPGPNLNVFGLLGTPVGGGINFQLFATRGYAVLAADAPMRGGVDMFDLAATVLPGVNEVVAMGVADPDRLGITGVSYGGYASLATIAQTPRFKAAVVRSGLADYVTYATADHGNGHAGGPANIELGWGVGGTLWQRRPTYIENSPLYNFDRIVTPVLVIHGTADWPAPVHLGDQIFFGLQRLGKTVTYARYSGAGHVEAQWRYADARDAVSRIVAWFDRYVRGDPGEGHAQ